MVGPVLIGTFGEPTGQGWEQIGELATALFLSAAIGMEREIRQKSAGVKTHALVGMGAALFVLVSKYGFTDVLVTGKVVLDPSRVAAQIVSGIGFIGGGLIFVRRDSVKGLTTAAVVWLTAAIGAACGAGLPVLALAVTVGHFIVVLGFSPLVRHLPRSRFAQSSVEVTYEDGRGLLRTVLAGVTGRGFTVASLGTQTPQDGGSGRAREIGLTLDLRGGGSVDELVTALSEIDGVLAVRTSDTNNTDE